MINGIFSRTSPANFAKKIGMPQGWFVVSWRWMPDKKKRRLNHGKWFKITSDDGCVYRILRFSVDIPGSPDQGTGRIVTDWTAWLELSGHAEKIPEEMEITISKVSWWKYPMMVLAHPDPIHKMAGELGLLSVLLGILSVIIAIALT